MWLILASLSLLMYAVADIFGKKCADNGNPLVPLELCISCSTLSFVIGLILYAVGAGESGMAPWELLSLHPLIIANSLCFFLQWVMYLLSMKYISLAILEAIGGSAGVFYFAGLLLINLFTGRFPVVEEMLTPLRLIPVILVLAFMFIYPNADRITNTHAKATIESGHTAADAGHNFTVGFFILLLSLMLDSADSLLTALIIDSGTIDTVDYMMTSYFSTIIPTVAFSITIRIIRKKWFIPFRNDSRRSIFYIITALPASMLFVIASYFDAVQTGILFLAYPIVPIIGAKLFLKEKHTWLQNLCIWGITISAIVFCLAEYLPDLPG